MNADDVFEQLDPPPGGAARFAQRLDDAAAPARPASWRPFAVAGASVAVAIVAVVATLLLLQEPSVSVAPTPPVANAQPPLDIYNSPAFDRLLGRPLEPAGLTAVIDTQAASVSELESQNDKVRIYQLN